MSKRLLSMRNSSLGITLLAIGLLTTSYCFQYGGGLQPCPLCLVQRYSLMVIAVIFLLATWHNPKRMGSLIYASIGLLFAIGGALAAGRQVWLQQQPIGTSDTCIPGLDYLFAVLPTHKAISVILSSPSNCAEISWRFLGISMPGWSLFFFIVIILAALWQIKHLCTRQKFYLPPS
ncbi:MAG: disulfide bond formation protein B [Gammaproteobacteria bacterium]